MKFVSREPSRVDDLEIENVSASWSKRVEHSHRYIAIVFGVEVVEALPIPRRDVSSCADSPTLQPSAQSLSCLECPCSIWKVGLFSLNPFFEASQALAY